MFTFRKPKSAPKELDNKTQQDHGVNDKRLFVVSLSGDEPMSMVAGYRDGSLHVSSCTRLPRDMRSLKKSLPERMKKNGKNGFIVLVDEVTPYFYQFGRAIKLSDINADGRPVIVSAMQAYLNMRNLQSMTLPKAESGAFDISPSIVEEVRDAKGAVTYRIDWPQLRTESTLLLLTIHAATSMSLLDKNSVSSLLSHLGAMQEEKSSMDPFIRITKQYDQRYLSADIFDDE